MQGTRLDILGTLGSGGFGSVYRVLLTGQSGFQQVHALKVGNPNRANPIDIERLRDEARVLGKIRHRAVVGVHSLLRVEGRWAILMEHVEGVDLGRVLRDEGAVPVGVALEVVAEVASALDVAFRAKDVFGTPLRLVHRDIKPSNLMVTAPGEVKILDFGIAKFDGKRTETLAGNQVGSLMYMAPERFENEVGPEGDIYALGSVLFELLTGRQYGFASTQSGPHTEHVQKALGELAALQPQLPEPVVQFVGSMLAFNPQVRPAARAVSRWARGTARDLGASLLEEWSEGTVAALVAESGITQVGELHGAELLIDAPLTPGAEAEAWREETQVQRVPTTRRAVRLATGAAVAAGCLLLGFGAGTRVPFSAVPETVDASHERPAYATAEVPQTEAEAQKAPVEVGGPAEGGDAPTTEADPAEVKAPPAYERPEVLLPPDRAVGPVAPPSPVIPDTAEAPTPPRQDDPSGDTAPPAAGATALAAVSLHPETVALSVELRGVDGQSHSVPGAVPPGEYVAYVQFPGSRRADYGKVDVGEGGGALRCKGNFGRCDLL